MDEGFPPHVVGFMKRKREREREQQPADDKVAFGQEFC
jgi:hypothetical protein